MSTIAIMEEPDNASSTIARVGHDASTNTLHVEFKSGQRYTYSDVPASMAADFKKADSPGKFHASAIKGQFDHERLNDDD